MVSTAQQTLLGSVDDGVHLHGGDIVSYNLQGHDGTSSRSGVIVPQMGLPGNPAKRGGRVAHPSISVQTAFLSF